jgi:hypothetical protein
MAEATAKGRDSGPLSRKRAPSTSKISENPSLQALRGTRLDPGKVSDAKIARVYQFSLFLGYHTFVWRHRARGRDEPNHPDRN